MYVEDETYFALVARLDRLEAAQRDPEADRFLNLLAWAARIDINELVKNGSPVMGATIDPTTDEARVISEPFTAGQRMLFLHMNRPFMPRCWRRITDAERLRLCLRPYEEATALVEFKITDWVEGQPVYRAISSFWLDPDPALLGLLHTVGDGLPCAATRQELLAAGKREAGGAQVPQVDRDPPNEESGTAA